MREIFKTLDTDIAIHDQKEQEQKFELVLDSQIFPHRGHTLFEIEIETGTIRPAEYNLKQNYFFNWSWKPGDPIASERSLIRNAGCVYISALNKTQALKKYLKEGGNNNGSKFSKKGTLKLF